MYSAEYLRHCYFLLYDFMNDDNLIAYCNDFGELKNYTTLNIYQISNKFNISNKNSIVINSNNKLYKVFAYYDINWKEKN